MNEEIYRVLLFGAGAVFGWVIAWWVVEALLKRIGFDVDKFWWSITLSIHSLPLFDRLHWPEDD